VLRAMARRYDSSGYLSRLALARDFNLTTDAIVGFPTEDEAAWERSIGFVRSLGLAGLHVFRYSPRPGTAAVRMRGQIDEPTKKRRAAELLALAAESRARWAAARVGTAADVLFETRLDDGRWVGHAADHTLVAARPPSVPGPAHGASLENHIGRVAIDDVDPTVRDRVVGRIRALSAPTRGAIGAP